METNNLRSSKVFFTRERTRIIFLKNGNPAVIFAHSFRKHPNENFLWGYYGHAVRFSAFVQESSGRYRPLPRAPFRKSYENYARDLNSAIRKQTAIVLLQLYCHESLCQECNSGNYDQFVRTAIPRTTLVHLLNSVLWGDNDQMKLVS